MLTAILDQYGLYVYYNEFIQLNISKLILQNLTVVEKNTYGKPKGFPLIVKKAYLNKNKYIIFPRIKLKFFNKYNLIKEVDIKYNNTPRHINKCEILIPLYQYQEDIVNYLVINKFSSKDINNNTAICYLQMDTGLGKSRIGCSIINEILYSALIVVPTIAIGLQWIDECKEIYPDRSIIFYHNSIKDSIDVNLYDITIIVINTFCRKNIDFISGYGIIIFDEVHEYYTSCNSKVLWIAQTKVVLGLSATPLERPDELDKYITMHLGQPIYAKDITNINANNFKVDIKCINYYGNPTYSESVITEKGTMSSILTINNIIKDPDRLNLLINEINILYNEGYSIFVFAEHRNFLDVVKKQLIDNKFCLIDDDESNMSIFRGGINNKELKRTKDLINIDQKSHIVLTTYGYSRRGISLTNMTAIILATPRRNGLKQIIGRILRKGSDESITRKIIDIVDMRSGLKSQFNDRKKIYIEKKYNISYIKHIISNEDIDYIENKEYTMENILNIIDTIYK